MLSRHQAFITTSSDDKTSMASPKASDHDDDSPSSSGHHGKNKVTNAMTGIVRGGEKAVHSIEKTVKRAGGSLHDAASRHSSDGSLSEEKSSWLSDVVHKIGGSSHHKAVHDVDGVDDSNGMPAVPPDATLKKMSVVLSKRLKNVSMSDFYEYVWSEGNRTDKLPLYGPWLEETGKQDVKVGEWAFAEDDGGKEFTGDWCGETYKQQRVSQVSCLLVHTYTCNERIRV